MTQPLPPDDDARTLLRMGYAQELLRRMGGFSNFAISLSIICILAGGVTSFAQGFCSVGGAAIGLGWPLVCLFSLCVAATMGQVASAFPTAGGLYHWAAILGGRGWGWLTAWFNLLGLITVLAAINAGTVDFVCGAFELKPSESTRVIVIAAMTFSHGLLNHFGIRLMTKLTDFSGWWILFVAIILTAALLVAAPSYEPARLVTFANYSGEAGGDVVPPSTSLTRLFALSLLLPAYTLTGFDASAHVAEETVGAAREVPRAIVRSVWVSGLFGWAMLVAVVLAMPALDSAAGQGGDAFVWTLRQTLGRHVARILFAGIGVAQYLCGLATVTSASRMAYAFARDGGLPLSRLWRQVDPQSRSPVAAIWLTATAAVLVTALIPYPTIAAICAVLLYISYVLPTVLGAVAFGRSWTRLGPWHLGRWYRPLAVVAALGCVALLAIGIQPPNEIAAPVVGGTVLVLVVGWFGYGYWFFPGPPGKLLDYEHKDES